MKTKIEILVVDKDGSVLHHREGEFNYTTQKGLRANYTRLTNRLMRVFPNFECISIKPVEV